VAWVDGAAILAQVGIATPSAEETAWADACADAIDAGIDARLDGSAVDADYPELYPELTWAALIAGADAYKRRETPFGVTGYADLTGAALRVARDPLEAIAPIIGRYATAGIA
jgi:hypothetical protein